ncbi:hypothetical protein [Dongia sedimenti]|uniref:HdeA/HdeB family protein n=1 Tax=Dongia sedimenti TaxID=3064282 RepID=A0ABU0YQR9_9PROT|nr:hypothetical protein [Rhodospirillaceae bacterium R-7]
MRKILASLACAGALLGTPLTIAVTEAAADTMAQGWMAQNYTCAEYLHGRLETKEPERSNYSYAFFFALGYFEARYVEHKDGKYLDRITRFHADLRRVCQAYPSQNLLDALSMALPVK